MVSAVALAACAPTALGIGRQAEHVQDYDRAIVEYTKVVRTHPDNKEARAALQRVRLLASQEHYTRGRRLQASGKPDQALLELQIASELNPTDSAIDAELRTIRNELKARIAVQREGKTELETLIQRTRNLPPPGFLRLPGPPAARWSSAPTKPLYMAWWTKFS